MRKISSEQIEARRKRRNQIIVGLVLIFLMFFSTIGFAFQMIGTGLDPEPVEQSDVVEYNGFEFISQGDFWFLNKDGSSFIFRNNPNQIQEIIAEVNGLDSYLGEILHIYSDSVEAESEIRVNLRQFVQSVEEIEYSEINCDDNSIIIQEVSDGNSIEQIDNCIFIKGDMSSLTEVSDEFLFKILGVRS